MNRQARFPLALTIALVLSIEISAQLAPSVPAAPSVKPSTFAVVSIRPHKDNGNYSHWWTPTPNGYAAYNVQVFDLIFNAYELKNPGQVVGLPRWGYDESFDIEAKVDENDLSWYQKLTDRERREQAAPMLRAMLAERFNLQVHHETRILPVYALVVAKSGFKLKQSQAPENLYGMMTNRGVISTYAGAIGARFIVGLSDATGRIVVDRTGLTGYYDINLKWTPDEDRATGASGPSLFTALEEQLGLKLVSQKAPIDVIVVDHVERPSEN